MGIKAGCSVGLLGLILISWPPQDLEAQSGLAQLCSDPPLQWWQQPISVPSSTPPPVAAAFHATRSGIRRRGGAADRISLPFSFPTMAVPPKERWRLGLPQKSDRCPLPLMVQSLTRPRHTACLRRIFVSGAGWGLFWLCFLFCLGWVS